MITDQMIEKALEAWADAPLNPREAMHAALNAAIGEAGWQEKSDEMDDFCRAVSAGNNPRTDEPFATVARWIRRVSRNTVTGSAE